MTSRFRRTVGGAACGVAAALAIAAWSQPAHADDEEAARAAMLRGVAAFGRGQAEAALAEYEAAKKLAPNANAPYRYAAQALVGLGRHSEAVENLEAYLKKNASVSDAQEVRDKIAKIKADFYPARVEVVADAPDAIVRVDGAARGAPGKMELEPGKHRIEVRAPGRAMSAQDVTLIGDRDATFTFALQPEEAPSIAPAVMPPAPRYEATPWPTIGWIGVGVGGALVVTGLVLDLAVLGPKVDEYDTAAAKGDPNARDLRDSASGLQTAALVTYIAGGVIAAGGAAVLLFAPKESLRGMRVVPAVGPGHAGLVTRLVF